jgi:hypothetical protein
MSKGSASDKTKDASEKPTRRERLDYRKRPGGAGGRPWGPVGGVGGLVGVPNQIWVGLVV